MSNYTRKRKRQQTLETAIAVGIRTLLLAGLVSLFVFLAVKAIDKQLENQDRMFCESAKISGNVQYLHKCECYYRGENIKCLQSQK